jgi:hypothetical protein
MSTRPQNHPHYQAILEVAAAIQVAEREADAGIRATAKLIVKTLDVQVEQGLAPASVEPVMAGLKRAIAAHMEGRAAILDSHKEYGRLAADLGATASSWGPTWPCKTARVRTPERKTLRAVA